MATITMGTNAQTTLVAIKWLPTVAVADLAAIQQHILNDGSSPMGQLAKTAPAAKPIWPGALTSQGKLYIPNRGVLQVLPGDYVAYDANGWPILVSANAVAGGSSPSASTSWTKSA